MPTQWWKLHENDEQVLAAKGNNVENSGESATQPPQLVAVSATKTVLQSTEDEFRWNAVKQFWYIGVKLGQQRCLDIVSQRIFMWNAKKVCIGNEHRKREQ